MSDDPQGMAKAEPKDEKRRQQILVASGVAGLLLTVILIRRSSSKTAQALPVSPAVDPSTQPPSAGSYSSGVSSSDFFNLESQVQGLSSQLSAMSQAPGPVGNGGTASPTSISISLASPVASSSGMVPSQPTADVSVHGMAPTQLAVGQSLPPATGSPQSYRTPSGEGFVYG